MATISRAYNRPPDFGPEIYIEKSKSTKPRVLLGWNHRSDNPQDLESGKIWCWASEGNHFQVFDENFNRSKIAGEVRDCGVANFTMVRMFHEYWCPNGEVPQDMVSEDKRKCRNRYRKLLAEWQERNNRAANPHVAGGGGGGGGGDDEDDDNDDPHGGNDGDNNGGTNNRTTRSESSEFLERIGRDFQERRDEYFRPNSTPTSNRRPRLNGRTQTEPLLIDDSDSDTGFRFTSPLTRSIKSSPVSVERFSSGPRGYNPRTNSTQSNRTSPKQEDDEDGPDDSLLTRTQPLLPTGVRPLELSPEPELISNTRRSLPRLSQSDRITTSSNIRSNSMPMFHGPALAPSSNSRNSSVAIPTIKPDVVSVKSEDADEDEVIEVSARKRPAKRTPILIVLDND